MTPIINLQGKVVKFNKRKLGEPKSFTVRITDLGFAYEQLSSSPFIMVKEPNTDQLTRIFLAVLDLAHYMKVDAESLIRIAEQRLEIDEMQRKAKEMAAAQ